jgi:methionyl-tRNA formyltransferase
VRILYLANNLVGLRVLEFLKGRGEEIAGLVVHPPGKQKCATDILAASGLPENRIFHGETLGEARTLEAIAALGADIGVSVFFGYILRAPLLRMLPSGCINLHPALLPFNRGSYPNVWSIVDGTPAGVTLHYIDEGVDTGDIIAQREVAALPSDTGESLYRKLEEACVDLFQETWPAIRAGNPPRAPQPSEGGTTHRMKDVDRIDRIELDKSYPARELIDVIRARTFAGHRGAYFEKNGKRVYMRIQLFGEEEG